MTLEQLVCPICYQTIKWRRNMRAKIQEVKCNRCKCKIIVDLNYIRKE